MSIRRTHRVDRRIAEQLLSGEATGHDDEVTRLVARLRATGTPGTAHPLAGEDAAVAAFRAAKALAPVPHPRRPSMLKSTLAKLLTVKAGFAVVTVLGAGGVALAAGTEVLPNPLVDRPAPSAATSPGQRGAVGDQASPGPRGGGGDRAGGGQGLAGAADPAGGPRPSLPGLCRAYAAKDGAERGKALESPAFTALITAAGGRDEVAEFCAGLDAPGLERADQESDEDGRRRGQPTAPPGQSGGKPERPEQGRSDQPAGPPATLPPGAGGGKGQAGGSAGDR